MPAPCYICGKETKYICKSCRKHTCKDHLSGAGFVEPTGLCPKCEKEEDDNYPHMRGGYGQSGR